MAGAKTRYDSDQRRIMDDNFLKSADRASLAFALTSSAQAGGRNEKIAEIAAYYEGILLTIRLLDFASGVKKSVRWHNE